MHLLSFFTEQSNLPRLPKCTLGSNKFGGLRPEKGCPSRSQWHPHLWSKKVVLTFQRGRTAQNNLLDDNDLLLDCLNSTDRPRKGQKSNWRNLFLSITSKVKLLFLGNLLSFNFQLHLTSLMLLKFLPQPSPKKIQRWDNFESTLFIITLYNYTDRSPKHLQQRQCLVTMTLSQPWTTRWWSSPQTLMVSQHLTNDTITLHSSALHVSSYQYEKWPFVVSKFKVYEAKVPQQKTLSLSMQKGDYIVFF